MKDSIRLHHHISKNITKYSDSNYTAKEIQANIKLHGVYMDGYLYTDRLEKVFGNEDFSIKHWPQKAKASYEGIEIVWEDKDFMLLFKPYGLPVQEGAGHKDNNLVNWLLDNVPGQKELKNQKTGENNEITAGLVHRIDKDTQGLILVAKHFEALKHGQDQFRNRFVKKTYLTVISGQLQEEVEVSGFQFRDPRNMLKQVFIPKNREALIQKQFKIEQEKIRECLSTFTPLLYDGEKTLCKVRIQTGRMHQIRVAAEALGVPIIGDKIYFNQHAKISEIDYSLFEKSPCDIRSIEPKELDTIINTVFKGHSYYLLSNELIFKDMDDKEIAFKIHDIK